MSKVRYAVLVNYNFEPANWWRDYDIQALLYDRSDDGIQRKFDANVKRTANVGNVDYDKLCYLIDYYDSLPEVFLWSKTNIFKSVYRDDLEKALEKGEFTPLLKMNHKTYSDRLGVVCFYSGEIYWERNDSWYVNQMDSRFPTYDAFAQYMNLPSPAYLPFPPGGNFILTRERVHRYGRDFYEKMRDALPYAKLCAEAHMCERTYYS